MNNKVVILFVKCLLYNIHVIWWSMMSAGDISIEISNFLRGQIFFLQIPELSIIVWKMQWGMFTNYIIHVEGRGQQ